MSVRTVQVPVSTERLIFSFKDRITRALAQPAEEHLSSSLQIFTGLLTLSHPPCCPTRDFGFNRALPEQPLFLLQVVDRGLGTNA